MSGFTVHPAKVQRPPLRGETLARDRLLDWLHVQIHHRVVLVLAEAGYGKTTLLTDFSGRTRLRTLWYRLDEDDRDWVTFLQHLVAAGREHDPDFAPQSAAMLSDMGVAGPTRDAVIATFLRELPAIADNGAVLILDDFHLVDDAPDVKLIARELVARGPERLTIVFSSRRAPGIPVAKLRASGEVAELRTDDLRFDVDETARLFSETYGRPLEPDVLADLSARTEGWAASLQLVQAALRDRSPSEIRSIVRNLTGEDHELYDYLAEEVVGDLPDELQGFLMHTSILQTVSPELATLVTDRPAEQVRQLIGLAERLSLLSRPGRTGRENLRYHPLVRDFLEARLKRSSARGDLVTVLHRRVAEAVEKTDWRLACHHYVSAGDPASVARVIDAGMETIVAKAETVVAETFLPAIPVGLALPSFDVIRSRSSLRQGHPEKALEEARAAAAALDSVIGLANLASVAWAVGALDLAAAAAVRLRSVAGNTMFGDIGGALETLLQLSIDGVLIETLPRLQDLREQQRADGLAHYEGLTLVNMASVYQAQGDAPRALGAAEESLSLLNAGARTDELAAAQNLRSWALAHLGRVEDARVGVDDVVVDSSEFLSAETLIERADIETWYGSSDRAAVLLDAAQSSLSRHAGLEARLDVARCQLALRRGDLEVASFHVAEFKVAPNQVVSFKTRQLALRAHAALAMGERDAVAVIREALQHSKAQGAGFWTRYNEVLAAAAGGAEDTRRLLRHAMPSLMPYISILAELAVSFIDRYDDPELHVLELEASRRPERWLGALRRAIEQEGVSALNAGRILDKMGGREDIPRLRSLVRKLAKGPYSDLGRGLARRIAPRVTIEDQGRVAIRMGEFHVEGTTIRRKVLALLCLLLTRPRFSATKDEVLDSLWPDADPGVALNSLNQTIYFLRRVLEPEYREDTSAGYVRHESDVVWLDRQLVSSRSQRCSDFIKSLPPTPTPDDVNRLATMYHGPFALDFAYESWAEAYRDSLHAAYLGVVEKAVAADTASGHFDRGIALARRALQIDPEAEHVEISLLRLLRLSGAHAAAAEQYAHYASLLKESLGLDAPPLEDL